MAPLDGAGIGLGSAMEFAGMRAAFVLESRFHPESDPDTGAPEILSANRSSGFPNGNRPDGTAAYFFGDKVLLQLRDFQQDQLTVSPPFFLCRKNDATRMPTGFVHRVNTT
jgi:hypothetical protein